MSSFTRTIQRRNLRNKPDYESAPQPTRDKQRGEGYATLHPTKGWLEVAALRYFAQMKMAQILTSYIPRVRTERPRKNYSTFKPVSVVEVVTRQQRRFAERKGAVT